MTETAHEFDYEIKDENIERSRLLIGLDQAYGMREFYSSATPDALRNFARGYGDDNLLFVAPGTAATLAGAARSRRR